MSCEKCVCKGDYNTPKSLKWIVGRIGLGSIFSYYLVARYLSTSSPNFIQYFGILVMIFYWITLVYAVIRDNVPVRYVFRWLDPVAGEEHQHLRTSSQVDYESPFSLKECKTPIVIRQKVSGWNGSSVLIIPDGCQSPSVARWSLDQSSTLGQIVLVDRSGMKFRTTSLDWAIWTISHARSVEDLLCRAKEDRDRVEEFGKQRDRLIGALLHLNQLVTNERQTFGNSVYGALTAYYTENVLTNVLSQEFSVTQGVFTKETGHWQRLGEKCVVRFGRR